MTTPTGLPAQQRPWPGMDVAGLRILVTGFGVSGYAVAGGEHYFKDNQLAEDPLPLFWGRDEADPIITAEKIAYTREWVAGHTDLTAHTYTGIGHGVAAAELTHISAFLNEKVLSA